jgi:hypothetical protein
MERIDGAQGNAADDHRKLNSAVQRGLDDGELRQRLVAAGYEPARTQFADDFARFIHADTAKWVALVETDQYEGH